MVLLFLVLFAEAGVALFVMRDLPRSYASVEKMYNGTVQGLLRIGDRQYDARETRRNTLYALTTNNGNLRLTYAGHSHDADRGVRKESLNILLTRARLKIRWLANAWRRIGTVT